MFRVFVHVYIHHFDRILELKNLKAEAHGNTLFRHFYFFVKEFQLIEDKELEPLKDLIEKICKWMNLKKKIRAFQGFRKMEQLCECSSQFLYKKGSYHV